MDKEERSFNRSIEAGKWKSASNLSGMKKRLKKAAENTILKDRRMNIRIAKRDLDMLKVKALQEGLPYQTLVSSILHKYLSGKLKESVK